MAILRAGAWLIQWTSYVLLRFTCPKWRWGNLTIMLAADDVDQARVREKLGVALEVLRDAASIRSRQLERLVSSIVVHERGGPEYIASVNSIVLPANKVMDLAPEQIALCIIHELTHARIHRAGIRYNVAERGRIERVCVRREARLAKILGLQFDIDEKLKAHWWDRDAVLARRREELDHLPAKWKDRLMRTYEALESEVEKEPE